jgi:hypothetical protein
MTACSAIAGLKLRHAKPRAAQRVSGSGATVIARPAVAGALLALMVLGSLAIWTAIPIAGLWVASQLTDSAIDVGTAPLIVVAGGIPVAMVFTVRLLARVERSYVRVTGTDPNSRVVPAWGRSLGDPSSERSGVLDRIMVGSVVVVVAALAVWFFAFAGSSLPG